MAAANEVFVADFGHFFVPALVVKKAFSQPEVRESQRRQSPSFHQHPKQSSSFAEDLPNLQFLTCVLDLYSTAPHIISDLSPFLSQCRAKSWSILLNDGTKATMRVVSFFANRY